MASGSRSYTWGSIKTFSVNNQGSVIMLTFATLGKLRREPTTRRSITISPLYGGQGWGPWQTDPRLLRLSTWTWNLTFILTK